MFLHAIDLQLISEVGLSIPMSITIYWEVSKNILGIYPDGNKINFCYIKKPKQKNQAGSIFLPPLCHEKKSTTITVPEQTKIDKLLQIHMGQGFHGSVKCQYQLFLSCVTILYS